KGDVIGPWILDRIYNDQGVAVGYKRRAGLLSLSPTDQQAWKIFPDMPLHFGDLKALFSLAPYTKTNKSLSRMLDRWEVAGVIVADGPKKSANRTYTRVTEAA